MEDDTVFPSDSDLLDLSFTSCTSNITTTTAATDRTFASSSARSSLTSLSFNDSRLSLSTPAVAAPAVRRRPHRDSDPHWSAIRAATSLSSDGLLHLRHLKLLRHLGSGNLGRVFLCRLRDSDDASAAEFALKVVDRDALTLKKLSHVETEAEILSMLDHPFLPTLYARFEASHYTCLLIDYCSNGDLHSLLRKQPSRRFPTSTVRYFAAEVLVALEYLHALGVVYRDLKPENVLLREDGHVMLSDFDLCFRATVVPTLTNYKPRSRLNSGAKNGYNCFGSSSISRDTAEEEEEEAFVAEPTAAYSKSCVGTHEYLAPEVVAGVGHGNGVDWWAFGVFIYELVYGTTPFKGASKESTLRNIASTRAVKFEHMAEGEEAAAATAEARDLIQKLLVKDPRKRLGSARGATDIKRHPFFDGVKWPLIRGYRPPELRGLVLKKPKVNVGHVGLVSQRRGRWWGWKRLGHFLRKNNGLKNSGVLDRNKKTHYYCLSDKVRKCA